MREKDARIVHTMHDEIIVEAKSEIAEEVAAIVQKCMIQPFEEMLPSVTFKVEPVIRATWDVYDMMHPCRSAEK